MSRIHLWWWAAVALVLLLALPPVVCMELHNDPLLFDTYARTLQRGGVMYRDGCETNLPGMTWLQWGIRSALGWRPETLRAVDLLIVGATLALLACWHPGVPTGWRFASFLALAILYLTTSEWCHAQRDVWMLLPALGALWLRRNGRMPLVEGGFWAVAFWIKPYVAVPILVVWAASVRLSRRDGVALGRLLFDTAGLLACGLLVGAAGIAWMKMSGSWPYFVEMATVWNPEYFRYDVTGGRRWLLLAGFAVRFFPWLLVHLAAIPVALRQLLGKDCPVALLAALYLGWLFQSAVLQHMFDYVQLPAVLLGVAVVAGHVARSGSPLPRRLFAAFLVVAIVPGAIRMFNRLEVWPRCWREGSSPQLRDRLSVMHKLNWEELERTADYLRSRSVHDGELTCFNMPTAALYRELDIEASTRYHFLQNNWLSFRSQRPRILNDLAASRQRFVVVDLTWKDIDVPPNRLDELPLPPTWDRWKGRIVFRAERYAVLEIPATEMRDWMTECFPD